MLGFTFGLLLVPRPLAAQDDCKVVLDAMTKIFDTPTHAYADMNMGGTTQTVESIYAGGVVYAKAGPKWSGGMTTKDMKDLTEKNRKTNKITCRHLNDEAVNGEMTAVYSVHEVTPRSTSDSKTWVSKAKGLPVRSDMDLDGGKSHISMRYEYGNVKPPM